MSQPKDDNQEGNEIQELPMKDNEVVGMYVQGDIDESEIIRKPLKQQKIFTQSIISDNPEQNDVQYELQQTKKRYEKLLEKKDITEVEKKTLITMLNNIKQQIAQLSYVVSSESDKIISKKRKFFEPQLTAKSCLETIFEFYCKQSYTAGKCPTFDKIQHENHVLSMSKFMIFCRDFNLVKSTEFGQAPSSLQLNSIELIQIFKKNSKNYKQMDFQQFQTALHRIAFTIFSESNALQKMYEHLGMLDETSFRKKLKMLRIPFSYKQTKKIEQPLSNYKFEFFAHGGKLEEGVKETVITRKDEGKRRNSSNRSTTQSSNQQNKIYSSVDYRRPSMPNKPSRMTRQHMITEPTSPNLVPVFVNRNYVKIEQPIQPVTIQSNNSRLSGYSSIYQQKRKKILTRNDFQLSRVVAAAKDMANQEEQLSKKPSYLADLIEDEDEDEYLTKHYELESQPSRMQKPEGIIKKYHFGNKYSFL